MSSSSSGESATDNQNVQVTENFLTDDTLSSRPNDNKEGA